MEDESSKTLIIQKYLKEKFSTPEPLDEGQTFHKEHIPNIDDMNQLIARADLSKTTGYDYIPYSILKEDTGKELTI